MIRWRFTTVQCLSKLTADKSAQIWSKSQVCSIEDVKEYGQYDGIDEEGNEELEKKITNSNKELENTIKDKLKELKGEVNENKDKIANLE